MAAKKAETKKTSVQVKKPVQRTAAKKSAQKTKPAPNTKPAADAEIAALVKELRSLVPKLDAEGLQFLIEQAQVHLYNMQVDELNRSMERKAATAGARGAKAAKAKSGGKVTADGKKSEELRIEGTESGSSFYIVYRGQYVMFSRNEIAQMVRIAAAPVLELERREHLFDWFERERRDLFAAVPIADKFDERLKKIAALLAKNFKLKE
jgi:hypothetical protein